MSIKAVSGGSAVVDTPVTADNTITVKAGDTLTAIARHFGVSLKDLIAANPQIKNADMIFPGQEVKIPNSSPVLEPIQRETVDDPQSKTCSPLPEPDAALAKAQFALAQRAHITAALLTKAGQVGASPYDFARLTGTLSKLPASEFDTQAKLVSDALNSGDPERALKTYLNVESIRSAHPDRITNQIQRALVMGVGTSRTATTAGKSGVIGQDAATRAAKTLVKMPQSEYVKIAASLNRAGQGGGPNGSAITEQALILKAVAARQNQLSRPGWVDQARLSAGLSTFATDSITRFADAIRGQDRNKLIENSTVQDLGSASGGYALQQRFSCSCAPTGSQITKAEADPIYSLHLHQELVHNTNTTGDIADEQKSVLTAHKGVAVARTQPGGIGMQGDAALNDIASSATHRTYTTTEVDNSASDRTDAMDEMASLLRQGIDAPFRVDWNGGGAHFEVASDVRGYKPNREFLIDDPWNGKTGWVKEADIAAGNTNFFSGTGRLGAVYSSSSTADGD